jgi:hypothetical protein
MLPALLAGLAGALAVARRRRERHYPGLVFEDLPPDAIQTLSIFESLGPVTLPYTTHLYGLCPLRYRRRAC